MAITTDQIRDLRQRTGAGILEVKKALEETDGDADAAIQLLRERGLAKAAKKAARTASDGRIVSYIHGDPGRIGVLLELNCETDFVARTPGFRDLAQHLAMQIAAASPEWVSDADVPEDVVARERATLAAQLAEENKPPQIVEKMIEGRLNKWLDEAVLLRQPFIRDNDITVGSMIQHAIAEMGENIVVRRFARFAIGE
ncbi:translation elongation factor Ts [bacterium]|nr:translation elongation factor Ts [Chloroflexi bacterium CFX6]RIL11659.1 MAG: translation elongation factor Ts [bacterium]